MADSSKTESISTKQARIARLAKQMPGQGIRSLACHLDHDWYLEAYRRTKKGGAVGVDGRTSADFGADLDGHIKALQERVRSGTYRAPPVRRVHIPKGDGSKTRPIGIPTFEDKVLQRAVVMLLEPIYEQDFYDFSYGFRPGRSAHQALAALDTALSRAGGGWVLDVDLKSFFDTLDHQQLRDLLRLRVADGGIIRLVGKWLRAGVLEGGVVDHPDTGTPQGGVVSPLLANIYLHEALDRWWVEDVQPRLRGFASMVRYADDFALVFERREDAERVQAVLPRRMQRFGLTVHPDKTRLIRFTRPGPSGKGPKSGSFDFLGFRHFWTRTRRGKWHFRRKTASSRFSRSLKAINIWMRTHRHRPLSEQAAILGMKLRGHFNYYGVLGNSDSISRFRHEVQRLWRKWLSRRSQKGFLRWDAFDRLLARYQLPPARIARRQLTLPWV